MIEYLDLTTKNYELTEHITAIGQCGGGFDAKSLYMEKTDELKLTLRADEIQNLNLNFEFSGDAKIRVTIRLNGNLIVKKSLIKPNREFRSYKYGLPKSYVQKGDNILILEVTDGAKLNIQGVELYDGSSVTVNKKWMSKLSDSICIGDVNLPGTHDSAAVNRYIHSVYACHYASLQSQLEGGIRLLDVRIKVKKSWSFDFYFCTCHGSIGSIAGANEYEPLVDFFNTIKSFLIENPTETVVATLKIDDWNGYESKSKEVLDELDRFLDNYPIYVGRDDLPKLGQLRGKILLMNRINEERRFGVPLHWVDNTSGEEVGTNFKFYLQDKYQGLGLIGSEEEKADYFWKALIKKSKYKLVLNFASATWFGVTGIYIGDIVLNTFGSFVAAARPQKIGWAFFDYEFTAYSVQGASDKYLNIVEFWIDSNFGYAKFPKKFVVSEH